MHCSSGMRSSESRRQSGSIWIVGCCGNGISRGVLESLVSVHGVFDSGLRFLHNTLMARKKPFELGYDPATREQLRAIPAKYHSLIRKVIEEQLRFQPETETRNRKP